MATYGTDTRFGVPTAFQFSYNGATVDWGTTRLLEINDVTNQADPINNKIKISDLTANFIDNDGQIWSSLGNGTSAFNKSFSGTVFVGGSMGQVSDDLGNSFEKINEVGAWTVPFHTGKIKNVSKSRNVVTISSQSLMGLLEKLKWQFPITTILGFNHGSHYQGYSFGRNNGIIPASSFWTVIDTFAAYDKANSDTDASFFMVPTNDDLSSVGTNDGLLDYEDGTGINTILTSGYRFLEDSYYQNYKTLKFRGSFLGTFKGTISKLEKANELGWASLAESEAHVNVNADGTFYPINKIRYRWLSGTADTSINSSYLQGLMTLTGDPTAILRHLLFGKMVTRYYNQDDDMSTDTFYQAAKVTAFKVYTQTINPEDEFVLPYIQELLKTESALFYAGIDNKFNFEPYGPKNLQFELDEIGTVDIIDSDYTNDINDTYNRVILNYGYSFETGEFTKKHEGTLSDWDIRDDRPLDISSRWIQNNNQANIAVSRQLARYKQTSPKVNFSTTYKYSGLDIGSLVKVTDSESGISEKIIQILDYSKGFSNSGLLEFSGYDGESLFMKKGYAQWEDADLLDALVTGTSTSGWGTTISGIGTCFGINTTYYGTFFVWW